MIFAGICALILTIGIARFAYTPLLPVMREQAGLSVIGAGWLATISYVGYLGGAMIAAAMHTLERKFLLYRIGLVVAVASTFAMGLTHDFRWWLVLRLLAGWSGTAGMLLASGLVMNWLLRHGRRGELGIHFAGFGLGMVISGLAVIVTAHRLDWRGQWEALGVLAALFMWPAWHWLPAPSANLGATLTAAPAMPSAAWLRVFALAYFFAGIGYVITATFIVDIVRNLPGLPVPANVVWIIMGAVAIPSCVAWDRVSARIGQMPALTLAFATQAASFVIAAFGHGAVAVVLSAVLFGMTVIGTISLTLSIAGRLFPANPARAMARLTMSYGAAQITGPLIAAYISHGQGDFHRALEVATIAGVIASTISLLLCVMSPLPAHPPPLVA